MKKISAFLFLLCISCKSITYYDLNPQPIQNEKLLPAMEPVVDLYNLESVYSLGVSSGYSVNYGHSWNNQSGTFNGTSFNGSGQSNWLQTGSYQSSSYRDARINDTINIFTKEVKDNITNPYGAKKGYIVLKLGYRGYDNCQSCRFGHAITFGLLCFIGVPTDRHIQSLEVEVEIYNKKQELIKRYKEHVRNSVIEAVYYGYHKNAVGRKLAADNIKQALVNIKMKIASDYDDIIKKLK